MMTKWTLLALAIASEVTATMALRASVDQPGWIVLVVIGYLSAFTLLGLTLRIGLPLGVAYGIWGASGVALTALLGWFIFDEVLSTVSLIGVGLIVLGVLLVETGAPKPPATPMAPSAPQTRQAEGVA